MPLLVWVKAEGANDAEAFRAEISASSTSAGVVSPGEGNTTVAASAQQTTTSAWWLHSSEPVVGDILDAAVKLFFPARGASGRQYNTQAFELWLQKRRLTNFAQSASDVIEEALKHALDVTPTVSNRSGTMDQFMLLRRQGVVFELRIPASPYSNAKRPFPGDSKKKVTPKTGHYRPQEQQHQRRSDTAQTAPPPRTLRAGSPRDGATKSPSRSPPSSDSPRTSEISSQDVKAPAALTPFGSTGPAMWIPKSTVEKFYPGKACDKFTPRWGVPKVCDICFEHIASHSTVPSAPSGAVVNGISPIPLSSSPPRRHTLHLPSTPRTPLHIATPRLGAEFSAASEMLFMSPSARLGDAAASVAAAASYAAARSVYTKTCPQFLPLWGRNDHCSNCYRPVHWHDGYLHDLALKRRRFVMTLRQHHDKEHHRKLMAILPWHHVYHFLSVGDILSCACVSRVCSLTARVLLKSIMALVVKYEAPGDMRMRILRDADRIATALNASRTLSFASIFSTKVLTAVVAVCRCDPSGGGGDGSAGEADIAVQIALLQAFHENSSSSVVPPPPPAVVQRGSSGKRRQQQGTTAANPPARLRKSQGSNVSNNNSEDNSSPLARGDTASPALSSVSGTAHNNNNNDTSNSNSRIPSIIAVIHTVLQIEPEDLTSEALEAIRDIPRTASSVGRTQRSTPPVISFREHLVSRYGSHNTKAISGQRRMSPTSSLPTDGDADDAQQSALTPLVNYLLTLAHLNLMKKQASRYLEQSFSTL